MVGHAWNLHQWQKPLALFLWWLKAVAIAKFLKAKPNGAQAPTLRKPMYPIEESEANEIRLEAMYLRRYNNQLLNHPDCRDPDHPTCELCDEENDDDA